MNYSIIIPYNELPDLLLRAVKSIPDRADIEIIIINNGTVALSDELFETRQHVQVLWDAVGKGAGAARNIGVSKAKGEWLVFLDADDYLTEGAFDAMDSHLQDQEDIVFFKVCCVRSEDGSPAGRHMAFNQLIDRYVQTRDEGALRYEWTSPWGKMIRSRLVNSHAIRFDETRAANDIFFSLLTGYHAEHVSADERTIYCVTERSGSLTTTPSLHNLRDRIEVSIRYNRFVQTHHLRRYRKSIMYYLSLIARHYGYGEALKMLWFSIRSGNNPLIGCTRWLQTARKSNNR